MRVLKDAVGALLMGVCLLVGFIIGILCSIFGGKKKCDQNPSSR